jgi:O-acetyl-ADP-ribose deacetylase (regulator of RNase III)
MSCVACPRQRCNKASSRRSRPRIFQRKLGASGLGAAEAVVGHLLTKTSTLPQMPSVSYITGDATAPVGDQAKIIVHVCNNRGGWGAGFVLAISKRWPQPETLYRRWHRGELDLPFELGQVQLVEVEDRLWVANLIGQNGTKSILNPRPIRYDAIRKGLATVAQMAKAHEASIHMPRIGAGRAGGDWATVERIIQDELIEASCEVTVYDLPKAK